MPEKINKLSDSQIELKICVPASELEKCLDSAAEEFSKEIKIDGFRSGKAPRKMIEQKIGSEKILAHAAEKAVKKSYAEYIVKNKIAAIGEPKITITKIAPGNDLEYKAMVAVLPEIILGNYRKQAKSVKKPKSPEIKAEDIEKELEILRKSRAKLTTVSREARIDDRVEIDFVVSVDGKEIEGGKSKNHPLTIGENYFIPGFEENLIGMKAQDEREFDLSFPSDYHEKSLAAKPAHFKVKMNIVQEKFLPELTDEFASNVGKFQDLAGLRKSIAEGMTAEQEKKSQEKRRQEILEKIIIDLKTEIPGTLVDQELEKMTREFEQNITSMGMNLEDYLANIKKTREELKKDWQDTAEKRVKSGLALREIAKLESITPESSELEEEMNKTLAYFKGKADIEKNIDMESLYAYVKGMLTNEKVFKFLENL